MLESLFVIGGSSRWVLSPDSRSGGRHVLKAFGVDAELSRQSGEDCGTDAKESVHGGSVPAGPAAGGCGDAVVEIRRKTPVTETTCYRWRKQYAGWA